jgi:Domain of unknown function (DUF4399)
MTARKQIMIKLACLACLAWLGCTPAVQAQPAGTPPDRPATGSRLDHPWQVPSPRFTSEAYFTNLKDGDRIETPFRATFGLSGGWGLAPISKPMGGKTGHHHLLLSADLPLDFEKALPFNDKYMHFGKGQMETVLTLEPGTYVLRLLLANSKHVLHFVYSKPITVTVTRKNSEVDPKSLGKKGISLLNLPPDAKLTAPFRLQFHASSLNVAHVSQQEKDTGHFRLTVMPQDGGKPVEIDFVNGQTEAWLSPPPGPYTLKLDFLDNVNAGKALADSVSSRVRIE